jgi:hypothetical protein
MSRPIIVLSEQMLIDKLTVIFYAHHVPYY